MNFEDISSKILCLFYKQDYTFTDVTLATFVRALNLVPLEEDEGQRRVVIMGESLRKVSFNSFMNLITVANKRVDLQIQNLDVMSLYGSEKEVNEGGFVQRLVQADHMQASY